MVEGIVEGRRHCEKGMYKKGHIDPGIGRVNITYNLAAKGSRGVTFVFSERLYHTTHGSTH